MSNLQELISSYTSQTELSNLLESDKFNLYSVKSYGAKGDNSTDDYSSIYSLINTTINGDDATLFFPSGTYIIGTSLTFPSNLNVIFSKGAVVKGSVGTETLTMNCEIQAGQYRIFNNILVSGNPKIKETIPEWFGATGDGTTDDTTAINNCFTYVGNFTNKVVKFNAFKTYLVSSQLNVPSGVIINGYSSKIKTSGQHYVLDLSGDNEVRGLEIQGGGNSSLDLSGSCINIDGTDSSNYVSNFKIYDCYLHDIGGYGILMSFAENVFIENTKIFNIGYSGINGLSVKNVHGDNLWIKGITPGDSGLAYGADFTRLATDTLVVYPRSEDCSIINSLVEDNTIWEGLDTHAGINIKFINNIIKNCKIGIGIVPTQSSGVDDYASFNCVASGNIIEGTGNGAGINISGAVTTAGSPVELSDNNIISSNILKNCGESGNSVGGAIVSKGTSNISISNNTIENSYVFGINMYFDNMGFSVSGNSIKDSRDDTVTVPSGVTVRSTYNEGIIDSNNIYKDGTGLTETYVSVNGIYFATTTNCDVLIGKNNNNFTTPLSGATGQNVNFGALGNNANIYFGANSPEGVITASVGSEYTNLVGGAGTTKYIKESGTGNTGWVGK